MIQQGKTLSKISLYKVEMAQEIPVRIAPSAPSLFEEVEEDVG